MHNIHEHLEKENMIVRQARTMIIPLAQGTTTEHKFKTTFWL